MSVSKRYMLISAAAVLMLLNGLAFDPTPSLFGGVGFAFEVGPLHETDGPPTVGPGADSGFKSNPYPPSLFGENIPNNIRREVLEIAVGGLLVILGTVLILIALWRWRSDDYSLISFGVLCFLYGARTTFPPFIFDLDWRFWEYWAAFVTYLVPLSGWVFMEQILGKGWKSSIRLLIYAQTLFSLTAIILGLVFRSPFMAMPANNIMVIVASLVLMPNIFFLSGKQSRRESHVLRFGFIVLGGFVVHANLVGFNLMHGHGRLGQSWEPIGFLVLTACLGYIVVRRFLRFEKDLATISQEMETARQIQSFILPQDAIEMAALDICARHVPMAAVAGDFYDFAVLDQNRIGILVADVSGHGVPASLIGAMVKIAFAAQKPHSAEPAKVLAGLNTTLCGKLDSDFVSAAYCFIDTETKKAIYAGAGHPPLIIWRGQENNLYEYCQKGMILGQYEKAEYAPIHLDIMPGDRIVLYTDGIFEAMNPKGVMFGSERLKTAICACRDMTAAEFADSLLKQISEWSGGKGKENQDDDQTLLAIDIKQ